MADGITRVDGRGSEPGPEPYEPPRIDVLGTVGELTRGPDPSPGDVDSGVISF